MENSYDMEVSGGGVEYSGGHGSLISGTTNSTTTRSTTT